MIVSGNKRHIKKGSFPQKRRLFPDGAEVRVDMPEMDVQNLPVLYGRYRRQKPVEKSLQIGAGSYEGQYKKVVWTKSLRRMRFFSRAFRFV